mgnify:CR=1 FL=1
MVGCSAASGQNLVPGELGHAVAGADIPLPFTSVPFPLLISVMLCPNNVLVLPF